MLILLVLVAIFLHGLAAYFWKEAVKYRERAERLKWAVRRARRFYDGGMD